MMKTDVLNAFESISIGTGYTIRGNSTERVPFNFEDSLIVPEYSTLPGWNSNLDDLNIKGNIPVNLESYIQFIEDYTQVPISIISYGPERDQTYRRGE